MVKIGDEVLYNNILNVFVVGVVTDIKGDKIQINNNFWVTKEQIAKK